MITDDVDPPDSLVIEGERRGILRRLEQLERGYTQLRSAVQRVEIEQANAKEVLKSRFEALNRGQELLLSEIKSLHTMNGEPTGSAAGRALLREIDDLKTRLRESREDADAKHKATTEATDKLDDFCTSLKGGLRFVQWIGAGAAVGALLALLKAFGS